MSVTLVVSDDGGLAATVQSIAESLDDCEARWVRGLENLRINPQFAPVCLVVIHVSKTTDDALLERHCRQLIKRRPPIATLLIRDEYDGEQDLRFLRLGVTDCLTRPLDLRRLAYLIDSLTLRKRLERSRARKKMPPGSSSRYHEAYEASSPPMRQLLDKALRIAAKDVPVLLSGETGTGKTHLAQLIHESSFRAGRPFVTVNCGALPASLIESELFGHKKGAFTSADENREGKFAHAKDGTILLDEIDSLPLAAQTKLLRVLDERVFEQLGSNESLPLAARLITASNRSLEAEVKKGQFRSDLYYRLNVIQFDVPPLRDRKSEIHPLVWGFMRQLAHKHAVVPHTVDDAVWRVLEEYDWPGNIRELRNTIEYALTLCDDQQIRVADLPAKLVTLSARLDEEQHRPAHPETATTDAQSLAQARKDGEYRCLLDVLRKCNNNRSQAARELGISRTALYKKLLNYGIT